MLESGNPVEAVGACSGKESAEIADESGSSVVNSKDLSLFWSVTTK
jgi:hypothetical protein